MSQIYCLNQQIFKGLVGDLEGERNHTNKINWVISFSEGIRYHKQLYHIVKGNREMLEFGEDSSP